MNRFETARQPTRLTGLAMVLAAALLAVACDDHRSQRVHGVQQTGFPGSVTAGGSSSGQVIGRAGQAVRSDAPAGTPGIPQGSGGNTSGTALGGTHQQSGAEREKQQLAGSMQAVAERWRSRAVANKWPLHPPTPVDATGGFDASANQSGASGQPGGRLGSAAAQAPIKSEKGGTAAPSTDIKQDEMRRLPPGVRANAPDKVN